MVKLDDVLRLIDARKNRVLLLAEASLPATQFLAWRKLFLDELGQSGLARDLQELDRIQANPKNRP